MKNLDETIADVASVLDNLMLLKRILETGDCNNCGIRNECAIKPGWGMPVRYNCILYVKETGEENEDNITDKVG